MFVQQKQGLVFVSKYISLHPPPGQCPGDQPSFKNTRRGADLPSLQRPAKIAFLGKRRVLIGGKETESESVGDGEDDDEPPPPPVDKSKEPEPEPIHWHALPIQVVLDVAKAYGIKHIIDFTPTSLPLIPELLENGCSYLGICGTDEHDEFLEKQTIDILKKNCWTPTRNCTTNVFKLR